MIIEIISNDSICLLEISETDYTLPIFHVKDYSMVYYIGDKAIQEAIKYLLESFNDYVRNEKSKKEYPYERADNFMASNVIFIQNTASGIRVHFWCKSILNESQIDNTHVAMYLQGDDEIIGRRLLEFERQINK